MAIFTFSRAMVAVVTVSLAMPLFAQQTQPAPPERGVIHDAGAYLAGRQAVYGSDFDAAARYYARALAHDPDNPDLMENLVLSQLGLGQVAQALPVAKRMEELGLPSQAAHMVVVGNLIAQGDYATLSTRDAETLGIGPLVDGLIAAWAHMGAGSVAEALEQFDVVAQEKGLQGFALYHKAMALASVGDFEGAEALFAADDGALTTVSRRAALARAEILSQLERNEDALEMLEQTFGAGFEPALSDLVARLRAGEQLPFSHVTSVRDGMAEVFLTLAQALAGDAPDQFALIYARMAEFLRPDNVDAVLLTAELLEKLGQYDLAVASYQTVPRDSALHYAAELGHAEALRRADRPEAAIEVLEQLARDYPDLPVVQSGLGDLLRQQEDFAGAVGAYDNAIAHTAPESEIMWFLHYARGISHEQLDEWPKAEVDFRRALELNPDQPQVLNYLGYSMVEQQVNLAEALDMIERAVAARPDSGYIVDSLGWVLFRLGRYDESVGHMENAVALMPVDPVVNDHLGDVYWAVGRLREAEFQWKRALSFVDPDDIDAEADPNRIRRKLEIGLDAVLREEGAAPLKPADDNG